MHGLIFETSIWLLAGSTRYRSRLRRRRDGRPDAFLLGRGARARASSPYRYPSACNVNNISAATAARGLELRRRRRTPRDSARGPIARPPACNVNSISAATAARGLELGPRARVASSPYRYPSACNVNNISAATAARGLELRRRASARAPRGGGIGGSSLGASAVDWSAIAPRPRMPRRLTAFNGSDAPTLVLTRRRRCRPVGVCVCAFE